MSDCVDCRYYYRAKQTYPKGMCELKDLDFAETPIDDCDDFCGYDTEPEEDRYASVCRDNSELLRNYRK